MPKLEVEIDCNHLLKTLEILRKIVKKVPESAPIVEHYLSLVEVKVRTKEDASATSPLVLRNFLYVDGLKLVS